MDFQHRVGSKTGSGFVSESQSSMDRRERLRKLALEQIDISKDPYFMKNHLGTFECKLCLTLHANEGSYLAHTQGKRHQSNLGMRAAMEAKNAAGGTIIIKKDDDKLKKKTIKIGRPAYKVTKSRDLTSNQRCLLFEIEYPMIENDIQPRYRFMSAFEQKIEAPNKNYQYLLFAGSPYETIAFKIPNHAIDRGEGKVFSKWDEQTKKFIMQFYFV